MSDFNLKKAPASAQLSADAILILMQYQEQVNAALDSLYAYATKRIEVIELNGQKMTDPKFIAGVKAGMIASHQMLAGVQASLSIGDDDEK